MGKTIKQYRKDAVERLNDNKQKPRPLTPYEFTFCEWLAKQPVYPKRTEQLAKLRALYNPPDKDGNPPAVTIPVDYARLAKLKRRKEFKEYFAQMRSEELDRARAMFVKRMPEAVDVHFQAMELAMINHDYRSIPAFTNPVLDRVMPKKQEPGPIAAVKIELTPAQQTLIDIPEAQVEVVELDSTTT